VNSDSRNPGPPHSRDNSKPKIKVSSLEEPPSIIEASSTSDAPLPPEDVIVSVENVSKRFCRDLKKSLMFGVVDIGRETLGMPPRRSQLREDEFWALQNISFQIKRGDTIGLMGINGSGKTTLMRIITGLIKPTVGRVCRRGRIAPLLALGAGFNPILTGRENIYVNMSVLGLTRDEIDERFDSVVEFSEVGYALDAPVQNYSSGMMARLGFSCAIHTDPDILLIDEVMAVGDLRFRLKCQHKLREMRANGMTFIIVQHAPSMLLAVCRSGVLLRRGELIEKGGIEDVVKEYEKELYLSGTQQAEEAAGAPTNEATKELTIESAEMWHEEGPEVPLKCGDHAELRLALEARTKLDHVHFLIKVYRLPSEEHMGGMAEQLVVHLGSHQEKLWFNLDKGKHHLRVPFDPLALGPGSYLAEVEVAGQNGDRLALARTPRFGALSPFPQRFSQFFQPHEWILDSGKGS